MKDGEVWYCWIQLVIIYKLEGSTAWVFLSIIFSRVMPAIIAQFSGLREFVEIKLVVYKILKYSKYNHGMLWLCMSIFTLVYATSHLFYIQILLLPKCHSQERNFYRSKYRLSP